MNINALSVVSSDNNVLKTVFKPLDDKIFNERSNDVREAETSEPSDSFDTVGAVHKEHKPSSSATIFTSVNHPADKGENKAEFKPEPKEWTVLCFFNGNCDLESDIENNMSALENVGSDEKINFVAQMAKGSDDGKAERVFLKKPGWLGFKKNSRVMEELGKTNMAHPQVLKDFVTWGMKEFPAKHYMLIMNGHGMGFVGSMPDEKSDDIMLTPELQSAMDAVAKETGKKIDILGMDSCLMANAETAYALKNSTDFLVGSEEVLFTGNWDYSEMGSKMKEKVNAGELTVADTLKAMMESQHNYKLLTTSIIDCRDMPGFADRLKDFSDKLIKTETPDRYIKQAFRNAQHYCQPSVMAQAANGDGNTKPMDQMRDVVSLAMEIISSDNIGDTDLKQSALEMAKFVKDQVIVFEMHRKGMNLSASTGMSMYAPSSESGKFGDYYDNKVSLGKDTGWGKVIKKYGV